MSAVKLDLTAEVVGVFILDCVGSWASGAYCAALSSVPLTRGAMDIVYSSFEHFNKVVQCFVAA